MAGGIGGAVCDRVSSNNDVTGKQESILRIASKVFRWISIAVMAALVIGTFIAFGFGWFLLAGLASIVALRAVFMVFATLLAGHDAKPLPKWFDTVMYEALTAGMIIFPSLIIGAIAKLI